MEGDNSNKKTLKSKIKDSTKYLYSITGKGTTQLKSTGQYIYNLIMNNKFLTVVLSIMLFSFIISLIMITGSDTEFTKKLMIPGLLENANKALYFFIFLLSIIVCLIIFNYRADIKDKQEAFSSKNEIGNVISKIGVDGIFLFTMFAVVIIYVFYDYFYNKYSSVFDTAQTVILIFIIFGAISITLLRFGGFIFKDKEKMSDFDDSPGILNLIKRVFFYIPCLIIDFAEYIYREYQITPSPTFVLLAIQILLITTYFLLPSIRKFYNDLFLHDGTDLITERVYLDSEINLDVSNYSFQNRHNLENEENTPISYNYAVSSWIYIIDSYGLDKDIKIISYGDIPRVTYNGKYKILKVMIPESDSEYIEIYKTSELPLQKWNNMVFNFSNGKLDIFINGELVASKDVILKEQKTDIIVGDINGIQGELTDLKYFSHELSKSTIKSIYEINKNTVGNEDKPWWKFI